MHKNNTLLDKLYVWPVNAKPKKIANISKPKMRCGRKRTIRSIANRTSGEKSDEPPPDDILNRKAKFIPFIKDKFGFLIFIVIIDLNSAGCRSPPISFVFDFLFKKRNGGYQYEIERKGFCTYQLRQI